MAQFQILGYNFQKLNILALILGPIKNSIFFEMLQKCSVVECGPGPSFAMRNVILSELLIFLQHKTIHQLQITSPLPSPPLPPTKHRLHQNGGCNYRSSCLISLIIDSSRRIRPPLQEALCLRRSDDFGWGGEENFHSHQIRRGFQGRQGNITIN